MEYGFIEESAMRLSIQMAIAGSAIILASCAALLGAPQAVTLPNGNPGFMVQCSDTAISSTADCAVKAERISSLWDSFSRLGYTCCQAIQRITVPDTEV